ncbi:hypothetical protein DFJ77DRAFT_21194 [Powellomyces hirtus]|nr:hypothetical protein DFJ77DRAFT_21194 [Powellomyces hirtus]
MPPSVVRCAVAISLWQSRALRVLFVVSKCRMSNAAAAVRSVVAVTVDHRIIMSVSSSLPRSQPSGLSQHSVSNPTSNSAECRVTSVRWSEAFLPLPTTPQQNRAALPHQRTERWMDGWTDPMDGWMDLTSISYLQSRGGFNNGSRLVVALAGRQTAKLHYGHVTCHYASRASVGLLSRCSHCNNSIRESVEKLQTSY